MKNHEHNQLRFIFHEAIESKIFYYDRLPYRDDRYDVFTQLAEVHEWIEIKLSEEVDD